ncbi:MAG: fibronectin type III domain-containing protein [Bdellovibrionota bacterium]|nr:fibronectin type III domain-containing protein [Bdellovibrionota bacterium]
MWEKYIIKQFLSLFILFFLYGCFDSGGGDESGGGGLFVGHKEVENIFLITPAQNKTYVENEHLDFVLTHPYQISVTGVPRLELTIGSSTVFADYLTGNGTRNISFRYTVQAGDLDTDGIDINSTIDLNGGTLTYSSAGSTSNATTEISNSPITASIKVDTIGPTLSLVIPPQLKTYYLGEQIDFIATFNEITYATGTPRIPIDIGGSSVYAEYVSGSGSTTLIFRYIVQASDFDNDGIDVSSPVELNAGSLKDAAGNNSSLSFIDGTLPGLNVDGDSPFVTSYTLPSNKTYLEGELIVIDLIFSEAVTVAGGTPHIDTTVGSSNISFGYLSGSGTNTLRFRWLVTQNQYDNNGIVFGNSITLNGATIQDGTGNDARLDLSLPLTPNVLVDSRVPTITSITPPADSTYTDGQNLDFVFQFSEAVGIGSTPRLAIELDSGTVYADYLSGSGSDSITFRYTIQAGDYDSDGIAFNASSIDLNGGTIIGLVSTNTAELDFSSQVPADMTGIKVNNGATQLVITQEPSNTQAGVNISPSITVEIRDGSNSLVTTDTSSITVAIATDPSAGAATLSGTLTVNAVGGVATFSDLNIDKAHANYTLIFSSGSLTAANSSSFTITPGVRAALAFSVQPSNADMNIAISPSIEVEIQDAYGNKTTDTDNVTLALNNDPSGSATLGGTLSVAAVNGTASFSDISLDYAGVGFTLDATATGLTTATSSAFNINQVATQLAVSVQPTNTDATMVITPAIQIEVQDANGIVVTSASDDITVAFNNDPSAGTATLGGTTTVAASSGVASFSDLTIDISNTGYTLDFSATGLTTVTSNSFDINSPVPTVTIDALSTANLANYTSYIITGTCSEDTRTVTVDIGGISATPTCSSGTYNTGAINLTSIADTTTLNITADHDNASATPAVQATQTIIKDTSAPTISSVSIAANTYSIGEVINISVGFDQNVTVTGSPRIEVMFESQASANLYAVYNSGSGSSTLVFQYTVQAGDADANGIDLTSTIDLNSGTLLDDNANPSDLNLSATNFGSVLVDSAVPSITEFIEPVNGTYPDGVGLLFQVNFNEAVNVTGSPRVLIDVGGVTKYATYKTGSGTSGLEFEYIVQPGDADADGISFVSTVIDLNSGTVKGLDTDNAVLDFSLYDDDMSGVLVDTASGITPPDQVTGLTTAPTTSNTELALSWAIPADNGTAITSYAVQYREQGQSTWITQSPATTTNSTTITGLSAGITYEFRVAANNGLLGPFSATATAEIFDILSLDPIAWLDATNVNGNGSSPADGQKVASWADLTGAASNATEANAANQPVMAYNAQNGLPAVRFDDQAVGLEGSFVRNIGTDLTFVIVGQFDTGYSDKCLFEFRNGGGNARGFFIDRRYASNNNYNPALTKGSFQLWRIENDGPNATVTENSSTNLFTGGINFDTDFTGTGNYVLGDDTTGGNRMYGYIAEFLVFDRALTAQEISTLEQYLKNKWGTP